MKDLSPSEDDWMHPLKMIEKDAPESVASTGLLERSKTGGERLGGGGTDPVEESG